MLLWRGLCAPLEHATNPRSHAYISTECLYNIIIITLQFKDNVHYRSDTFKVGLPIDHYLGSTVSFTGSFSEIEMGILPVILVSLLVDHIIGK